MGTHPRYFEYPGHKPSDYPHLAIGKLRFVGEAVAVCLADTLMTAEDHSNQNLL